jgi:23S rRNA maturation mini-RNase III
VCHPKHVEQLRNIGVINSITLLYLVGSFYETYVPCHEVRNVGFKINEYDINIRKLYGARRNIRMLTEFYFCLSCVEKTCLVVRKKTF